MSGASRLVPLPSFLALLLAGAHFWRAGFYPLAAACGLLAALAWTLAAWVRLALLLVIPLLAARWIWITGQFVQMRMVMGQPWQRLAVILLSVALLTALAALPLLRRTGMQRYTERKDAAGAQLAAAGVCLALLVPVWLMRPQLFVLERFFPQWGMLQIFLAAIWAALAAGWLCDGKKAPRARMRLWRLFSAVFFVQLVLGLAVESRFLLSGQLHLPVPGLIAASPLYRGGGWFMLGLFSFSTLLAGAAWCSHLCYFGVWDATAAQHKKFKSACRTLPGQQSSQTSIADQSASRVHERAPVWLSRLRLTMLGLTLLTPLTLRFSGAPLEAALACGLLLGLLLAPCALLVSRKQGYAAYCRGICPLGLLAQWIGRLAPWRVRRTGACRRCTACVRVCRQDAMTLQNMMEKGPNANCHLCRDCLAVCPQQALSITFFGSTGSAAWAGHVLTALLAGLHAAFLAMARI